MTALDLHLPRTSVENAIQTTKGTAMDPRLVFGVDRLPPAEAYSAEAWAPDTEAKRQARFVKELREWAKSMPKEAPTVTDQTPVTVNVPTTVNVPEAAPEPPAVTVNVPQPTEKPPEPTVVVVKEPKE